MSEDNDKLAEITADSSEGKDRANPSPTLLILLILPLFGIFVALLMLALETRQQPAAASAFAPAPPRVITNFEAPDFELPMLDGVTLASPADYAGRPLFLNFWATWCQPCVRELPAFEEFVAEHSANPDGPALLAINLGEGAAEISGFLDKIGLRDLPVALDINEVVKLDYGVQNLPTTFVIDGAGTVRHVKLGEMKYEEMGVYLKALEDETA
ncbi:MAG: TlpA disulfide reductase family protein [Chloroflexota bacterium]|nr:TlpA disulfide reductase family protein [Chloroflexota bacterium]MDE2854973.1 TlpA disulfide reductase family protein [Chloroflexota bacterium]MDE2946787.1 TlpA disulfide reductase family protein [Chloroflexota bacterium]